MRLRLAPVALLSAIYPAVGAQAAQRQYEFHIPEGSLDAALRLYARITGRQVLYRSGAMADRRFGGLDARLDADEALTRILANSGLRASYPAVNVVVVDVAPAPALPDEISSVSPETGSDIIVTGTNIRGASPTTSLRTISRRDIERSGRATVGDVIAAQPANFGGTGNPVAALTGADRSGLNTSVAPGANLRGFGSEATLTLFDGRRVAGSGGRGDFTDLSAIPTMAVERVEILTDGASFIYGSDAVGGVVNIVLRHRLNGLEMRLRGGAATDGSTGSALVGVIGGRDWHSGGILLAYEFERRGALKADDRPYAGTGDLRPFGGTDHRTFYSSPATIVSFDPSVGNFMPLYRVPALPEGTTPTVSQLLPGQNLYNQLAGLDLSPQIERHAIYGHAEQQVTPGLDGFLDVRFAHRDFRYRSPASIAPFLVTDANPYFLSPDGLPFGILAYSFYPDLGPVRTQGGVSSLGFTAGLDWAVGHGWNASAFGSFARERSHDRTGNIVNPTALDEATGTSPDDPATGFDTATNGFFNPYGSGRSNSRAILDFIGSGFAELRRRSSIADAAIKVDGPLFEVGGGSARIAVGGAGRIETFRSGGETFYAGAAPSPTANPDGRRSIGAAFAELNLPLVAATNAVAGIRTFTVSAAIRHERYSDFGATTNPKIGAAWSPALGITLRANWGTSFRAPALLEVNDRRSVSPTQLPDGNGGYTPTILVGGGNRELGPERATTWSGGLVLEPPPIPGLRMEVGLFSTRFRDRIGQPALQDILRALTDPALAPFVERVSPTTSAADLARVEALLAEPNADSAGGLPAAAFQAIVDSRYINTGRLNVSGLDFDVTLTRALGADRLDLGIAGSWLFHYAVQATPLSAIVDRLDTLGNPAAIKVRTNAAWTHRTLSATIFGNWIASYRDNSALPIRRIASFLTVDASLALAPSRGILKRLSVALNVENLFAAAPPFVDRANGIGFDAANANPFGRTIALELRRAF